MIADIEKSISDKLSKIVDYNVKIDWPYVFELVNESFTDYQNISIYVRKLGPDFVHNKYLRMMITKNNNNDIVYYTFHVCLLDNCRIGAMKLPMEAKLNNSSKLDELFILLWRNY